MAVWLCIIHIETVAFNFLLFAFISISLNIVFAMVSRGTSINPIKSMKAFMENIMDCEASQEYSTITFTWDNTTSNAITFLLWAALIPPLVPEQQVGSAAGHERVAIGQQRCGGRWNLRWSEEFYLNGQWTVCQRARHYLRALSDKTGISEKQEELREAREERHGIPCSSVPPMQLYNHLSVKELHAAGSPISVNALITPESLERI